MLGDLQISWTQVVPECEKRKAIPPEALTPWSRTEWSSGPFAINKRTVKYCRISGIAARSVGNRSHHGGCCSLMDECQFFFPGNVSYS